ncbi:hypothetical protein KKH18_13315, partial [bacterium]|nr:hypothetical protein [bacterium]
LAQPGRNQKTMKLSLLIIYALFVACAFAQTQPPVFVDRYETTIGRITINCEVWTDERAHDWLAALEDVKLTSGLILDLRGMTGAAESEIPQLLGYCFDEQTMSSEDAARYREFLNGVTPYTKPLLLIYSEHVSNEVYNAIELLTQSRYDTETTTCALDCKMSRKPLRRFKRHVHRIELEQQDRMDRMFEGTPESPSTQGIATPQVEPKNK